MSSTDANRLGPVLFRMLQHEIEARFEQIPSATDLQDLAEKLFALKTMKFPQDVGDGELSLDAASWSKALNNPEEKRFLKYSKLVEDKKADFQVFVIDYLENLETVYHKKHQMLEWFVKSLNKAAKKGQLLFLSTNEWKFLHAKAQGESCLMPWANLGYVLNYLIAAGKLAEEDSNPAYATQLYFRPLRSVILPEFDHNLQRLAAVEKEKLSELESLKGKVLAGLMTAGISFGQAIVQRLFPPHVIIASPVSCNCTL